MDVKAVRFISPMQEGWTKPLLFGCDDGNKYVVKLMNNPQGLRVLPNEMIASRLGRMLRLPVGECAVVHIPEQLLDLFPFLREMQVQPGPHLGCRYYKSAKVLQNAEDLTGCENLHKAAGMIAFDHWIENWDRHWLHATNVMVLQRKPKTFVMIDHANAFYNPWTIDILREHRTTVSVYWGRIYELFLPYIDGSEPFKKVMLRINSLTKSDLWSAMEGLPAEWNVSHRELRKLVKYLDYRKAAAAEALERLKKHFPKWRETSVNTL